MSDRHENGFEHVDLDLSPITPKLEYDLAEKAGGLRVTYLVHYVSAWARAGEQVVIDGSFHYALSREHWEEFISAATVDTDRLRGLARDEVPRDLADFEETGALPSWFRPRSAGGGEPAPKFLTP
jgi:hypothetical protein